LIIAIGNDGKKYTIERSELISPDWFGKHYLALFYSKFDVMKKDFKINIIHGNAMPKIRGEYTDYTYTWRAIDDSVSVITKLVSTYAALPNPVVPVYKPKNIEETDYTDFELKLGCEDCL
jgi:hypothetical protein